VAVPLLSLVIDARDAIVLVSVFQFPIGFLIIKNYRSAETNDPIDKGGPGLILRLGDGSPVYKSVDIYSYQ
jgi:hypothetical protein